MAVLCLAVIPGARWCSCENRFTPAQLEAARRVASEIVALFPGQVVSVSLDDEPRVVLSEQPNLPMSTPLLVRLCGLRAGACRSFVTFSGRQVEFGGERFDVLAGAGDEVLVVGELTLPRFAGSTIGGPL